MDNKGLWVLLLGICWCFTIGKTVKQEAWLYRDQGNALYFGSQSADLSEYNRVLSKVNRACATGMWYVFSKVNFEGLATPLGSFYSDELTCQKVNPINFKSLRHWAANDTSIDSISLYTGDYYSKDEILVTGKARIRIPRQILSLAATGSSSWMLFEGKNLSGKSLCYPVPIPNWYFNFDSVSSLNISNVGSVFKGCNLQEIQSYKRRYALL